MLRLLAIFALIVAISANCDNSCSGHGTCGLRGICSCYDNWGLGLSHISGDCSQRICPFEISWVDTPNKIGHFHKYAECANRGICNRDTGDCECFPGYEGKGCQRTTCPNDCSGHGQCTYIQDMPFQAVVNDYLEGNYLPQDPVRLNYFGWDKQKTRGCVCDPEYGDVDCSKRMCPYGTDVMDQRQDMTRQSKYQVQNINFISRHKLNVTDQAFALTFRSKLNETFTTRPIVIRNNASHYHNFILNVQAALESLPNGVLDKVEVRGDIAEIDDVTTVNFNVSFVGENVQGPQHLLTVKDISCGDGCTPKLTGLELQINAQNSTEINLSDFNSYECGRRGKCDYSSGICSCFSGYTGLSCGTITALV